MLGAIKGDVIGSVYEHDNYRGMEGRPSMAR